MVNDMTKHTILLADGREATICFAGDYIILEEAGALALYKKVVPAAALLDKSDLLNQQLPIFELPQMCHFPAWPSIADLTEQPNADSTL